MSILESDTSQSLEFPPTTATAHQGRFSNEYVLAAAEGVWKGCGTLSQKQ